MDCVPLPEQALTRIATQVSGFPFNLGIRHPQYVGATLTVWGLAALLHSPARPSLVPVSVCWSLLYVITAIIEDFC